VKSTLLFFLYSGEECADIHVNQSGVFDRALMHNNNTCMHLDSMKVKRMRSRA